MKLYKILISFVILTGCNKHLGDLGEDYILIDGGISGKKIVLVRQTIYAIDSIYITTDKLKIAGFTLDIESRHGNVSYKSTTNKLTEEMRVKLVDDPMISRLMFKDIKVIDNKGKGAVFRYDKMEVRIADYNN